MSVIVHVRVQMDYGSHCLGYIGNMRFAVADIGSAYEKVIPNSRH